MMDLVLLWKNNKITLLNKFWCQLLHYEIDPRKSETLKLYSIFRARPVTERNSPPYSAPINSDSLPPQYNKIFPSLYVLL